MPHPSGRAAPDPSGLLACGGHDGCRSRLRLFDRTSRFGWRAGGRESEGNVPGVGTSWRADVLLWQPEGAVRPISGGTVQSVAYSLKSSESVGAVRTRSRNWSCLMGRYRGQRPVCRAAKA